MEYRGKPFSVVQSINTLWKWLVPSLVGQTKSGTAPSRPAGIKLAQKAIDKALAPKKERLVPHKSG